MRVRSVCSVRGGAAVARAVRVCPAVHAHMCVGRVQGKGPARAHALPTQTQPLRATPWKEQLLHRSPPSPPPTHRRLHRRATTPFCHRHRIEVFPSSCKSKSSLRTPRQPQRSRYSRSLYIYNSQRRLPIANGFPHGTRSTRLDAGRNAPTRHPVQPFASRLLSTKLPDEHQAADTALPICHCESSSRVFFFRK